MKGFLDKISYVFGGYNYKLNKKIKQINALENKMLLLSDRDIGEYANRMANDVRCGKDICDIAIEASALVREAARRSIGQRHFDVQIIGGLAMFNNKIIDMKTGEGKTLAATIPAFLYALNGKGVQIVTVNDYLAERDANNMRPIFKMLGMTVGSITEESDINERKQAFECDITYLTASNLCFEYLRSNLAYSMEQRVQNNFEFCIVDEADFILIDEARIPLVLSSKDRKGIDTFPTIQKVVKYLTNEDIEINQESGYVELSDPGMAKVERLLKGYNLIKDSLYSVASTEILHCINQSLKANFLYHRDRHYIVKNRQICLVDELTGRLQEGRKLSGGLQQAVEAKEGIPIQPQSFVIASITFQNFFALYNNIAGMTGTALNDKKEFKSIYGMDVFIVPTNKATIRIDHADEIYSTKKQKYEAILLQIKTCIKKGQPVLIGTNFIEHSEDLSKILKSAKIKHQVLNAKNHLQESVIVANAGQAGNVTIATNMAGRGTDIKLGGLHASQDEYESVKRSGGLFIIGSERYSNRRVDDQLRGRSGRQGDPGESKFFISLEDDFMKIFVTPRIGKMLSSVTEDEGSPISHNMISKIILAGQKKIEGHNALIRKNLVDYDSIMDKQRRLVYQIRDDILKESNLMDGLSYFIDKYYDKVFNDIKNIGYGAVIESLSHKIDVSELNPANFHKAFPIKFEEVIFSKISQICEDAQKEKIIRELILKTIDIGWQSCISLCDAIRESVGFKSYGSIDPVHTYRKETYNIFINYINNTAENIAIGIIELDL